MAVGRRDLNIQEFLLLYALDDDSETDDRSGLLPVVHRSASAESGELASFRAEVERHNDRTMTILSLSGTETITRCGVCPKEESRPCMALRFLALPYAQHPAYRPEWRIVRADVVVGTAQDRLAEKVRGVVPRPRQAADDLPPPGNARRRILHQLGIGFSRSDFTDEELAQRGVQTETPTGLPAD